MGYDVSGLRSAQLLNQLGLDGAAVVDQLAAQGRNPGELARLNQGYTGVSGFGPARVGELLRTGLIAPGRLAPQQRSLSPNGYSPSPTGSWDTSAPGRAGTLARTFAGDPFARQQLEMSFNGRIVPQGVTNNGLQVVPFPAGTAPGIASGGPDGNAAVAQRMLAAYAPFAANYGGYPTAANGGYGANGRNNRLFTPSDFIPGAPGQPAGFGPNGFGAFSPQALTNGGFGNGGFGPGGVGTGFPNAMANGLGNIANGFGNGGGFPTGGGGGGGGFGGVGGGGSPGAILGDPSLTVEDKITLMIMMIMKQMDKQIEAQANYINSLQQQQGGQGGGGGKGGGQGSSPSIDVETMKLKRLIDKRSQMFDMLRQIIDKYNETAKNIIQSIGR